MYAIIDIETTGLNARTEKITEIAIFLHDGEKVIDRFETLVNPEKRIPFKITGLTGIDNRMVANAPKFCEIARKIVEMTEDTVKFRTGTGQAVMRLQPSDSLNICKQ